MVAYRKKGVRVSTHVAWLVVAYAWACSGKSSSHRDGDGGDGPSGNTGGTLDGGGGTLPSGGVSTTGGTGNGGTGKGGMTGVGGSRGGTNAGAGQAGDAGAGQSGDAGQAGDSGAGGAPVDDPAVSGRVIDFWLQPLSGVPVTIGTTTVTTDAQGHFTIPAVAPEYDASLVVSWGGGQAGVYGWRYEGLTRRDPTLQVVQGRAAQYGDIIVLPHGQTLTASRKIYVALAGPNGENILDGVGAGGVQTQASWYGPATMQANVHALLWEFDSSERPTAYRSYDLTTALLSAADATIDLSLADETIASGLVAGTVTIATGGARTNRMFARFPDGASIDLVDDSPGPDTFSYLAPTLPGGSVTVAASEGNSFSGPFAVVHRGSLTIGQTGVALTLPTPPALTGPNAAATGVTASTPFTWQGSQGTFVVHFEDRNFYNGVYVVTSRHQTMLGTFSSFTPRPGQVYDWRVQTHGSASSVDALAGPDGFMDPFSWNADLPVGPRQVDGSFAVSSSRGFTTAN